MKVLIVNASDLSGGAARAAYRLHESLLSKSIDSQMLVQNKVGGSAKVHCTQSKIRKLLNRLRPALDRMPIRKHKIIDRVSFGVSWVPFSDIVKTINQINPDIVHLHWVSGGMVKIEDLANIKAPIVWSLHDMWAFTGGCHYDAECGGYLKQCGSCKVLGSVEEKDISRKVFLRKQRVYSKLKKLTVIGLSRWLAKCASESTLFKDVAVLNLPNPIDTTRYKPFDKKAARELWGLPQHKKLVLFGAMSALEDPRKGSDLLRKALPKIILDDLEFIIFGSEKPAKPPKYGFPTHYVGTLNDDISLVALYSAADVMVVPSKQENLSNAIVESLSCGTPVVGFDIGGNADMIDHKKNGYLAKPFKVEDLAQGIVWVLSSANDLEKKSREKALACFDSSKVADDYVTLYKSLL